MKIETSFSPNGGCTDAIGKRIVQAKTEILIMAYVFTSQVLMDLLEKRKGEISIGFIGDFLGMSGGIGSLVGRLDAVGSCVLDHQHHIFHDKVMIIDRKIVITGSFNFTDSAEHNNAENLIIIDDVSVAQKYMSNYLLHRAHSTRYVPGLKLGSEIVSQALLGKNQEEMRELFEG